MTLEPEGSAPAILLALPTPGAGAPLAVTVTVTAPQATEAERAAEESRRAQHYLAEFSAGTTLHLGVGPALSLALGVGGKVPGTPLRLYLLGELAYGSSSSEGYLYDGGLRYDQESQYFDLIVGARAYAPLLGNIRLFVDALAGSSTRAGSLALRDASTLSFDGWAATATAGAGIQYRFIPTASIGVRVALRLVDDPLSELREQLGTTNAMPVTTTAGVTWHF